MKRPIKSTLQKLGGWGIVLRAHRGALWVQRVCYSAAVALRLGFTVQLRFLPPQFLEQPIFVSTSSIEKVLPITASTIAFVPPALRPVRDGDWDLRAEPLLTYLSRLIHFKLMYEMFVEHKPCEETSQYIKMEQEILTRGETVNGGGVHRNFQTIEQVAQHLEGYKPIFDDIKKNGYKSQEELGNPPFTDEIKVCIGRDGEPMYLTEGTHRLAIAKILDLECIPVGVWAVHKDWAERCFKKYGGGVLEAVRKGLDDIDYYRRNEKVRPKQTSSPSAELGRARNSVEPNIKDR